MDKRSIFFSPRNKEMIKNNVIRECEQTLGQSFNRNNLQRLDKSLNHYMNEIWSSQSQMQMLPVLNREVNNVTSREFVSYLTKPIAKKPSPAQQSQVNANPASFNRMNAQMSAQMSTSLNDLQLNSSMDTTNQDQTSGMSIYQEVGRSLEDLRKERQGQQQERPAIPDFRISGDEDGPSPMDLYQMAKSAREREASAIIAKTDSKEENDSNVFKTILGNEIVPSRGTLPPPIKTKKSFDEPQFNTSERNMWPEPRIMDPYAIDQIKTSPGSKQLTLLRQDNVIQYNEIEQNLFINSMDRDWTKDSVLSMNRYNFTVNFDPSASSQSNNVTPFAVKKFKNIVRIQLIKAIISRETLDVMISKTDATTFATTNQTNVLSFPSVNVRISEFQANNYGTNNRIDDSFGQIHYDAQWASDPAGNSAVPSTGLTTNNGFASLIPKFLTSERIFEPTPLATLQKMTIRLERPTSATLLSDVPDVINAAGIQLGSDVTTSIYRTAAAPSSHLFIRTDKYFSKFMWETGDRVIFRGLNAGLASGASTATRASVKAIEEWINRDEGHLVVGIGYTSSPWSVTDNANSVGYGNVLIIQSRFTDPTISGSITPYSFGTETDINSAFNSAMSWNGSGINSSHQVQLVFKVISREYDPATKIRPDNTY